MEWDGCRSPRDGFFGCVAIASGLSSRELDYRLTSFEGGHDRTEVGFDPAHHFCSLRVFPIRTQTDSGPCCRTLRTTKSSSFVTVTAPIFAA